MSIKKKYAKTKGVCTVTFDLTKPANDEVETVYVVGEFNNWSESATPMKRKRNGNFSATVDLTQGREYQFRYLYDDGHWENDTDADKDVESPFPDTRNSVIIV